MELLVTNRKVNLYAQTMNLVTCYPASCIDCTRRYTSYTLDTRLYVRYPPSPPHKSRVSPLPSPRPRPAADICSPIPRAHRRLSRYLAISPLFGANVGWPFSEIERDICNLYGRHFSFLNRWSRSGRVSSVCVPSYVLYDVEHVFSICLPVCPSTNQVCIHSLFPMCQNLLLWLDINTKCMKT